MSAYTTASSFLTAPVGTPALWADALRAHNPADADPLASVYFALGAAIGINADLALAQMCQETGWATSARYTEQRNMAGIGVTSGDVAGPTFASITDGVKAHYEHLVCYTMTADPPVVAQWRMLDPRHGFHDGMPSVADLIRPERKWAVPGDGYAAAIISIANGVLGNATTGGHNMPRIIVHAGHQRIGSITSDPNGEINAAALRDETGASGEMEWNVAMATELTRLLMAAGVDAVQVDAIYHPDAYTQDADLVYAVHYDGSGSSGNPQYCMAATVHSGPSTTTADSAADAFVADWYTVYPKLMGIVGDGPITVDMTEYYGGWYRSANTPMVLGEHCLGADANGIRADRPDPVVAARAVYMVMAKTFNINGNNPPPAPPDDYLHLNGFIVGGAFKRLYAGTQFPLQTFGLPLSNEQQADVTHPADDGQDAHATTVRRTVQFFERAVFVYQQENAAPWDAVALMDVDSAAQITMVAPALTAGPVAV